MPRGPCFRCGRYGHFARECFQPRVESVFSGGGSLGRSVSSQAATSTVATASPPRADPSKTEKWDLPKNDPTIAVRNDTEFRLLLKNMWGSLSRLVILLFKRFGSGVDLESMSIDSADASFLDSVPLKGDLANLVELEFQLGRRAEAHFTRPDGSKRKEFIIDPHDMTLSPELRHHRVDNADLKIFAGGVDVDGYDPGWWQENGSRVGIPGTLHRLCGISGRKGELIGVVIRIGRTVVGTVERMLPKDIRCSDASVLLVGPPNSGKTTVLREFARLLSDSDDRVVVVVDKTSEIAGASNSPHPAIGSSCRWMPVDDPVNQHFYMRMAVENLSPDTVMADELSTDSECESAKTISQRGVQLIATCHGKSMAELINDRERSTLLGGVTSVTLSKQEVDVRAAQGGSISKQAMMRKYEPLFGLIIELHSRDVWYVHRNPKEAIDAYLRREPILAWRATPGKLEQVVAHPDEDSFRYEPELALSVTSAKCARATMASKGGDLALPINSHSTSVPSSRDLSTASGATQDPAATTASNGYTASVDIPETPWTETSSHASAQIAKPLNVPDRRILKAKRSPGILPP